jgi:hypothetical protein
LVDRTIPKRIRGLFRPLAGRESRAWRLLPFPRLRYFLFNDRIDCSIHRLLVSRRSYEERGAAKSLLGGAGYETAEIRTNTVAVRTDCLAGMPVLAVAWRICSR